MVEDGPTEKELVARAESNRTPLPAAALSVSAFRQRRPQVREDPRERQSGTRRRRLADGGPLSDDLRSHGRQRRPQTSSLPGASMAESLAECIAVCARRRGWRLLRGRRASRDLERSMCIQSRRVERQERPLTTHAILRVRPQSTTDARVHGCKI